MKKLKKVIVLCLMIVLSVTLLVACSDGTTQIENKEFTVTYDLNDGGTNTAQFVPNRDVQQVNKYLNPQRITEPSKPTREGYDFGGWFYDKECTKLVKYKWEQFDHDITLYAKWLERDSYVVSFYCNDTKNEDIIEIYSSKDCYKNDVIKGSVIKNAFDKFASNYTDKLVGRRLDKSFVCYKDNMSSFKTSISSDIEISDNLLKYAVKEENHYKIDFYVGITEKTHEIRFMNKTSQIAVVPTTHEGVIEFDKAYRYVNGEKIVLTNDNFVVINGKRTMPKAIVNDYETFKRWQVGIKGNDGNSFEYYNEKGQLIGNENQLITDESGNPIYFVEYRKYQDIVDINLQTELKEYNIKYELWIPQVDENGNIVMKGDKPATEKIIEIGAVKLKYGSFLNKMPNAEVQQELDKLDKDGTKYSQTLKLKGWRYVHQYDNIGVKAGAMVLPSHQLKDDNVVVRTTFEVKKQYVIFKRGENEFFNTIDTSLSNTYTPLKLNDVNSWLKNPNDPVGNDLHEQVGGMYYIKPDVDVPINASQTFVKTAEMRKAERELLKHQYILKGFCLEKNKGQGYKEENLVIKFNEATGKLELVNGIELKPEGDANDIVLTPLFDRKRDNKVLIDLTEFNNIIINPSFTKEQNYTYNGKVYPSLNAQLSAMGNASGILGYSASLRGHKFVKWEVVETPFDNLTFLGKEKYAGVAFDNKYPVLGTTVIKPVFVPDEYTITFLDAFDKDIFPNAMDKITGNIIDKPITKADIDKVIAKEKDLVPNIQAGEKVSNYVFDDWYTSDLRGLPYNNGNIFNRDMSLTEFIKIATKDQPQDDYGFQLTRDLIFKARFVPVNYKVQFMQYDETSINGNKLDVKYIPADLFDYEGQTINYELTFKGVNADYFDKYGVLHTSTMYQYRPENDFFYYKIIPTELGKSDYMRSQSYIAGWYYFAYAIDEAGNIDTSKIVQVDLSSKSSISVDTVPFVTTEEIILPSGGNLPAGYKLVEDNTIKVFPKLKEFDVTIDANGGSYDVYDNNGNLDNPTGKIVVKGGMFGFDIPTGKDAFNNPINHLNNKRGCEVDIDFNYYKLEWNENTKQNEKIFVEDSHNINKSNKLQVKANTTFYINWKATIFKVDIIFRDVDGNYINIINGEILPEGTAVEYEGTVDGIYLKGDKNKVPITAKGLAEQFVSHYPLSEAYYVHIYEGSYDNYIYDGYYQNSAGKLTLDYALTNRTINCQLRYHNLHLTLDANGGKYNGNLTENDKILETYIDKDSTLTINQKGELTHKEDAYSAYVTKNQQNMHGEKYDQGAPSRTNYVFAGFSTNKKPNFATDKFYYGYKDHSDIKDYLEIFGNNPKNICWLGDTTNFMTFATGIFIDGKHPEGKAREDFLIIVDKITVDGEQIISKISTNKLYAIWIPVKTKVSYYKSKEVFDGSNKLDFDASSQDYFFSKWGGKVKYSDGSEFSDLLMPEDLIQNPYKYAKDTQLALINPSTKKYLVTWETATGALVDDGLKVGNFINFDIDNAKILKDEEGYYYLTSCAVVENIVTGIDIKYKVVNSGITKVGIDKNDYFTSDRRDLSKFPLELRDGFVYRKTYAIGGRLIDNINTTFNVNTFNDGSYGNLVKDNLTGEFYYQYDLTPVPVEEKMSVVVNTTYKHYGKDAAGKDNPSGSPSGDALDITIKNYLTEPIKNPHYTKAMGTDYYKAQMIRLGVELNNYYTERLVWISDTDVELEPNINDLTKNLPLNGNCNITFDGSKKPVVENNEIVLTTTVFAKWVKEIDKKVVAQSNYYYDKFVDEAGKASWTKMKNGEGEFTVELNGVINKTNQYIFNKDITVGNETRPNKIDATEGKPATRLTWALYSEAGQQVDTVVEGENALVPIIKYTDVFNNGKLVSYMPDVNTYLVELDLYEVWVPDTRTTQTA